MLSYNIETAYRAVLVAVTLGYLFYRWSVLLRRRLTARESVNQLPEAGLVGKLNKDREPGEWTPEAFVYPAVEPLEADLQDIKPIPYRPFRWGEYHITMGIRNMPWNDWIQLDNLFSQYHKIRAHRIKTRGELAVRTLSEQPGVVSGGHLAAKELVYELAEYLSRRYPSAYKVVRQSPEKDEGFGWYGQPQIKKITVVPVDETYDLECEDPMKLSALLIQDDLALMIEGSDGRYYFQAGAICVPGFWRMQDKIGMPLEDIHTSGNVPQYHEKLHLSMARFFKRMPVDKPVVRNNYFMQVVRPAEDSTDLLDPEELAWSESTNGNEDAFTPGVPGTEQRVPSYLKDSEEEKPGVPPPDVIPPNLRLRSERQTLRRLPRSGAIVFTIRTYVFSVQELAKEKGVPGRMASAVRGWTEDVAKYKGQRLYKDVLLPYLDECHRLQVENGDVAEDDRTTNYPF